MREIIANPIVAMLIMLGSLVIFHELGHYLVGRWCGIAIEKFSIGFGHRIASFRRGQTDFLIGWIPLGGYVKFYGSTRNEDVPEHITGQLYWNAPVWKRVLIVSAGPFANFFLAFLVFWGMVIHGIEHPPATVGDVIEGGRAQIAGILPGDRFLRVDGKEIHGWADIERIFQRNPERPLTVVIKRKDQEIERTVTPEAVQGRSIFGSVSQIGRVGVALSYPSAVVTLLSNSTPLAQAGLRTGDRIETWTDGASQPHKIHGLHETFELFTEWKRSGLSQVKVTVRPVVIIDDEKGRPAERAQEDIRTIDLNVSAWPDVGVDSMRQYATKLGVSDSHLTVGVSRGASKEPLHPGDVVVAWDRVPVRNIFHLQEIMENWRLPETEVTIRRDFNEITVKVPLKPLDLQLPEGLVKAHVLDISMLGQSTLPEPDIKQERNPLKAAILAIEEAYQQTSMMVTSLWQIISGAVPAKALGGPIMIAKVAGDSAKAGGLAFLASMAVISINLGLVNLFPIPVLDGGQLILLGAEALKRRPLEESTVENFQKLGFVIVMSLVVLAMYNDLSRFWGSIVSSIVGVK
jgi:regulator of sigma E protease